CALPIFTKTMRSLFLALATFSVLTACLAQVSPREFNLPNTPGPALSEIGPGGRVSWMTGIVPLGDPTRHNDFPSAASAPNGDVWTVWASYSGLRDELHARRYSGRTWYAAF